MKQKPKFMSDDVFQALINMLDSPWYKWHKACDVKRSWLPWKIMRFKHYVDVTKMAITTTLSYEFYPETCIPNVRIEKIDDIWSLDVHTWSHPDNQKI